MTWTPEERMMYAEQDAYYEAGSRALAAREAEELRQAATLETERTQSDAAAASQPTHKEPTALNRRPKDASWGTVVALVIVGWIVVSLVLSAVQHHPPTLNPVRIVRDIDCSGGSGNGPGYVNGPVYVGSSDPNGLDRDGDGWGCE